MAKEVKGSFRIPRKKKSSSGGALKEEGLGRSPLTSSEVNAASTSKPRQSAYGSRINPLGRRGGKAPVDDILEGMIAPPRPADRPRTDDSDNASNHSGQGLPHSSRPSLLTRERVAAIAAKQDCYSFPNRGLMESLLEHKMRIGKVEPFPEMNRKYGAFAKAQLNFPPPHVPSPIPPSDLPAAAAPAATSAATTAAVPTSAGPSTPPGRPPAGPRTPPGSPPAASPRRKKRRITPKKPPTPPSPESQDDGCAASLSSRASNAYSPSGSLSIHAPSAGSSSRPRNSRKRPLQPSASAVAAAELPSSSTDGAALLQKIAGMANVDVHHLKNCLSSEVFGTLQQMDSSVLLATVSTVLSTIAQSMDAAGPDPTRRRSEESHHQPQPEVSSSTNRGDAADAIVTSSTRDAGDRDPHPQHTGSDEMDIASEASHPPSSDSPSFHPHPSSHRPVPPLLATPILSFNHHRRPLPPPTPSLLRPLLPPNHNSTTNPRSSQPSHPCSSRLSSTSKRRSTLRSWPPFLVRLSIRLPTTNLRTTAISRPPPLLLLRRRLRLGLRSRPFHPLPPTLTYSTTSPPPAWPDQMLPPPLPSALGLLTRRNQPPVLAACSPHYSPPSPFHPHLPLSTPPPKSRFSSIATESLYHVPTLSLLHPPTSRDDLGWLHLLPLRHSPIPDLPDSPPHLPGPPDLLRLAGSAGQHHQDHPEDHLVHQDPGDPHLGPDPDQWEGQGQVGQDQVGQEVPEACLGRG